MKSRKKSSVLGLWWTQEESFERSVEGSQTQIIYDHLYGEEIWIIFCCVSGKDEVKFSTLETYKDQCFRQNFF